MFYYCTCSTRRRHDVARGKTPYRLVETNLEGICRECGHYAVACRFPIQNNKDLYDYLLGARNFKEEGGYIGRTKKMLDRHKSLEEL